MVANPEWRRKFNDRLDLALDEAVEALRPLFHSGVYSLPYDLQIMMHELMFKLCTARHVIIHGDYTPDAAEAFWQEAKARHQAIR